MKIMFSSLYHSAREAQLLMEKSQEPRHLKLERQHQRFPVFSKYKTHPPAKLEKLLKLSEGDICVGALC